MKQIIGFAGRKRCGKGAISEYLKSEYGAKIVTVANALKNVCAQMLNITLEQLNQYKDDPSQNHYVFNMLNIGHACDVLHSYFKEVDVNVLLDILNTALANNKLNSVRDMLQFVGTDIIRKYNPNWHVEQLVNNINGIEDGLVVVDDVRFPNEREAVEKLGGTIFFIIRPDLSIQVSNHSSETGLHWYDFKDNRIIVNNSSLKYLVCNFEQYYLSQFKDDECKILKSGLHCFDNERATYGLANDEYTDIDELKCEIRDNELLKEYGIFLITANSVSNVAKQYKRFYYEKPKTPIVPTQFVIHNPFIIENIKELL